MWWILESHAQKTLSIYNVRKGHRQCAEKRYANLDSDVVNSDPTTSMDGDQLPDMFLPLLWLWKLLNL